jgi:hypothetical protein
MARETHPTAGLLKGLKRRYDGALTIGRRTFHPKLVRGEVVKVKRVRCNEVDDFDLACLPDDAPLDHAVDTRDWVVRFEGSRICYSDRERVAIVHAPAKGQCLRCLLQPRATCELCVALKTGVLERRPNDWEADEE